ncbi:unnamed protein product [Rotaria sp. Silwood2]|nr:unnamed protein product [Rotaria sp. Silwood2]CAF3053385.1 unnamed protein product [Rotaria sp. Silwood2]CAF3340498.1 unnamed protein product [Rotaria sp. Silwood2]CAF4261440.1 unnamed protein product [Rotaria sp. Silwood2]CAF4429419.1 unnamed protein product [Rotaria sp. Silwood2]
MKSITNLHIETSDRHMNFDSIKRLIHCCHSSLQHITLIAYDIYGFNGQTLEKLFQICKKLKKFDFLIEYYHHENVNMTEQLHYFQSNWWLDDCRPPVLVYRDDHNYSIMASMPCLSSLHSLSLSINPDMWPLNKGHFDSVQIYFSHVTSVYFINNNQQPVLLDFLYLISQVFRSRVEYLEFKYWGFKYPRTLYELLINATEMAPCLPSIRHLKTSSSDWNGLNGMTLVIWLLLASNIRALYLPEMNNADKLQLGEELSALFTIDPRLKTISNRIERVAINWSFDQNGDRTKPEIFDLFAQIFPKAIICNV